MKSILIILANPKEDSFSFSMADKYKDLSLKQGHQVEMIDLYRDEKQQTFFTYEKANVAQSTKEMKYYQAKISKADELVFVFPYWWGSMPAILKNFIDWNLSRGFAFEYINSRPIGLLKNKKVKIFTTSGAPYFFYMLTGANRRLKNMFKKQIIEFCGMRLEEFNIFGRLIVQPFFDKALSKPIICRTSCFLWKTLRKTCGNPVENFCKMSKTKISY